MAKCQVKGLSELDLQRAFSRDAPPPPPCSRSLHLVRLLSIEEQLTNHTHTGNTLGAATNTLGKGVGTVTDAAGNIVTTAGKGVGDTVTGVTQGLGDTTKGK